MGWDIDVSSSVLEATYHGQVDISERYLAKGAIGRTAQEAGVSRMLIDLRSATVEPYGVREALRVVARIAEDPAFGHVAYLLPRWREDLVASVLVRTHGPQYFRIFHERDDAMGWVLAA